MRNGQSITEPPCGGHPHQSKIGSEEPIFDSFSLKGEAFGGNFYLVSLYGTALDTGQGFSPPGGEAVRKSATKHFF